MLTFYSNAEIYYIRKLHIILFFVWFIITCIFIKAKIKVGYKGNEPNYKYLCIHKKKKSTDMH